MKMMQLTPYGEEFAVTEDGQGYVFAVFETRAEALEFIKRGVYTHDEHGRELPFAMDAATFQLRPRG
jgi:hypothetical protein